MVPVPLPQATMEGLHQSQVPGTCSYNFDDGNGNRNGNGNNDNNRTSGFLNIFGKVLGSGVQGTTGSNGTNQTSRANNSVHNNGNNGNYNNNSSHHGGNNFNTFGFGFCNAAASTGATIHDPGSKLSCNSMATNLAPQNNGIARQSNLIDEVLAERQRERLHRLQNLYHTNFFSANPGKDNYIDDTHTSSIAEDIVSDLSRRINNLSVAEKQNAQDDIYGFRSRHRQEDPVQLNIWLNEMDFLIQRGIYGSDKRFSALRLAMHSDAPSEASASARGMERSGFGLSNDDAFPGLEEIIMTGAQYVSSQRLKFLRAADWLVENAVTRMAKYFELKLEYFGSDSLARDLTLDDLTEEHVELWRKHGFVQLAEERDAYGRAVMVFIGKAQVHLPVRVVIRVLLYVSMVLAQDETVQITGNDQIGLCHGQEYFVAGRIRLICMVFSGLPLRGVVRHICYNQVQAMPLIESLAKIVGLWGVVRMRLHQGTVMECAYNLMTYGIPRIAIPINNDGKVELEFHHAFLDAIKLKETEEKNRKRNQRIDRQIRQIHQIHHRIQDHDRGLECRKSNHSGRGERYQREPPLPNGMAASGLWMERLEDLPDDFLAPIGDGPPPMKYVGNHDPSSGHISSDVSMASTSSQSGSEYKSRHASTATPAATSISESGGKRNDFIIVPRVLDVIMGRGRHNKKKPGNRKLNELLESYQEEYEAGDKFQKTVLSEVVVSKMIEDGSRFLLRNGEKKNGLWVEVSLEKARDKVAHDFRNLRRNAKLAKNQQSDGTGPNGAKPSVNGDTSRSSSPYTNTKITQKRQRSSQSSKDEDDMNLLKRSNRNTGLN